MVSDRDDQPNNPYVIPAGLTVGERILYNKHMSLLAEVRALAEMVVRLVECLYQERVISSESREHITQRDQAS